MKMVLRIVLFLLMVGLLRYWGVGEVLEFDCQMVRPIQFLFRKKGQCQSLGDSFVCSAGGLDCSVSFYLWLMICNVVVARLLQFTSKSQS